MRGRFDLTGPAARQPQKCSSVTSFRLRAFGAPRLASPVKSKHSVISIVRSLGRLSRRWLNKNYVYRQKAVRRLVRRSGLTEEMSHKLIDLLFKELTAPKLMKLLRAELKDPLVLDDFRRDRLTGCRHHAEGPRVITHIFAGNVPNPAVVSIILGMLVKSVNVGKISSEDAGFLDIYLDSLKHENKELAKMNHLIEPDDRAALLKFMKCSDLVVAYGRDASLGRIRKAVPAGVPFFGYGHKVSFGVYTKEVLDFRNIETSAKKTASDIWMMDQRGCLSPTVIYLERGGRVSALDFSRRVAQHLSKKGRWLTLYKDKVGRFPLASPNKRIHFESFGKIEEVYKAARPFLRHLQVVALEAGVSRRPGIAKRLATLGANRICRAGRMQNPPITWHHDGLPNLASWVRWTDLED